MNFPAPWQHPMNDGMLNLVWDSLGSLHRRRDSDNLRSGYSTGAFLDGHVDWVFSQSRVVSPRHDGNPGVSTYWATFAFLNDVVSNPTEPDVSLIDGSRDYSFNY